MLASLASSLGVPAQRGLRSRPTLFAMIGGFPVHVFFDGDIALRDVKVRVNAAGSIPSRLKILRRQEGERTLRRTFATGDPELDRAVVIAGDPAHAAALLSKDVRQLVLASVGRFGASVSRGEVWLVESAQKVDVDRLSKLVRLVVGLARELTLGDDELPARLLAQSRFDPSPELRSAALRLLFERCAASKEAHFALAEAREHLDPYTRLASELANGAEGLARVALAARDSALDVDLRGYAARLVVSRYPRQASRELAVSVMKVGPLQVIEAALDAIERVEQVDLLPELFPLVSPAMFSGPPTERFYRSLLSALEASALVAEHRSSEPAIDPALTETVAIKLLSHPSWKIGVSAATLLGRVGTATAVAPLQQAANIMSWEQGGPERRGAAQLALQKTRSRLRGELGALSVVDPEQREGQLSLAADGFLSMKDSDEG